MKPIKIDLPGCNYLFDSSNKIHVWYRLEHAIASGKSKVKMLKAQIKAEEEAIETRRKQIHSLRMDAISSTDPIAQYMKEKKDGGEA